MPSIHFVERLENFKLVEEQENEWESGFWIVSKESHINSWMVIFTCMLAKTNHLFVVA